GGRGGLGLGGQVGHEDSFSAGIPTTGGTFFHLITDSEEDGRFCQGYGPCRSVLSRERRTACWSHCSRAAMSWVVVFWPKRKRYQTKRGSRRLIPGATAFGQKVLGAGASRWPGPASRLFRRLRNNLNRIGDHLVRRLDRVERLLEESAERHLVSLGPGHQLVVDRLHPRFLESTLGQEELQSVALAQVGQHVAQRFRLG